VVSTTCEVHLEGEQEGQIMPKNNMYLEKEKKSFKILVV
jgi:hypothetical protein